MEIIKYTSRNNGSLVAFFDLRIPSWGDMTMRNLKLFQKDGRRWIAFPSERVEKEGETNYFPYIYMKDKEYKQKFDKAVIEAIEKYCMENADKQNNSEPEGLPF